MPYGMGLLLSEQAVSDTRSKLALLRQQTKMSAFVKGYRGCMGGVC